jgi:hypothetical protein
MRSRPSSFGQKGHGGTDRTQFAVVSSQHPLRGLDPSSSPHAHQQPPAGYSPLVGRV